MLNTLISVFNKKYKPQFLFLLRLLAPSVGPVGGLELNDSHIRFFDIRKNKIYSLGLRIPPGIISGGKVLDKVKLISVLIELRKELGLTPKKKLNVIVTLPSEAAYLQSVTLPYLTGASLESAIRLNLQLISPMPFEDTYNDWQVIGEAPDNQLEVLGIFAEKKNVTTMTEACEAGGFFVIAVEPSIFALVRTVHEISGTDMTEPHIVLSASDAGMNFAGVKNNIVYFDYFVSWRLIYGGASEIPKKIFEDNVVQYVGKVLAFFAGHGNSDMKRLLLLTSSLKESFRDIIQRNFKLEVKEIALGKFDHFGVEWATAIGAYERGHLSRAADTLPSLSGLSTKERFTQYQIFNFFIIWRNAIGTVLAFLLIIYAGTNFFLQKISNDLKLQFQGHLRPEDAAELKTLRASAQEFNALQDFINQAKSGTSKTSSYFKKILDIASPGVNVKRIYIQSLSAPVIISGSAESEQLIIDFKNKLVGDKDFTEVNLPLTSIVAEGDHATFSMTLRLNSSNTQ